MLAASDNHALQPRRTANAAQKLIVLGISIALILCAGILSLASAAKQQLHNRAARDQQTLRAIDLTERAQDVADSFSILSSAALDPKHTSQRFGVEWLNRSHQLSWTLDELAIVLEASETPHAALSQAQSHASSLSAAIQAQNQLVGDSPAAAEANQAIDNLTREINRQLSATRIILQRQLATGILQRASGVSQQLNNWAWFFVCVIVCLCAALTWFVWRWWQRPFSATAQALHQLTSKATEQSLIEATASADIPDALASELHVLAHLIADGNRLALQAAQQAIGSRVSQQLFELAKTIPGVVFQYEYSSEGTRTCHFVSPKLNDFFPVSAAANNAHACEDASADMVFPADNLPSQDHAVPLGLTRSLFEQVFSAGHAQPEALAYDTALQFGEATQWVRTLATVARHSNGSTIINGVWLDVTDSIEQASALAKARQAAEQIAEEKARLLAVMSHEIRTPLNGILGMTQLALKGDLSARQTTRVESILSSSHHLMSIINDILEFSKIESGHVTLERTRFSLQQIIADACDLLAPRAAEKGLEFWSDIDADIEDQLLGDPYKIKQILINYLANAIKFTPSGDVSLQVRLTAQTEHTLSLQFDVRDTGIGIASEEQKKLFQAFHQADVSTTRKYGGTGLGLAISSHFASLLGGQTGVQSQLGQGSLFWFSAQVQRTQQAQPETACWLQHTKVLLVESHTPTRNALYTLLTRVFDCDVVAVNSGHNALLAVQAAGPQAPFELGLVAYRLIDGQAAQCINTLRQHGHHIPHWWLSAPPESIEDEWALQPLGVSRLLPKPINAITLRKAALDNSPLALKNDAQLPQATNTPPVAQPAAAAAHAPLQSHSQQGQRTRVRILVVDDNPLNRTIAAELLASRTDLDIQVDCVEDGHAAVVAVTSEDAPRYDAVLMDLQMPRLDGFSATRAIRAASMGNASPIFAMSAHHGQTEQQAALDSGVNGFIHKPIVEQELWSTLEQAGILPTQPTHTMPTEPTATADAPAQAGTDFDPQAWHELANSIPLPRAQALAEHFLQQSAEQLLAVQAAIAKQDWPTASGLLHQLSGTAGTFGLTGLGATAGALSDELRNKTASANLEMQLTQLQDCATAGQQALRALLQATGSKPQLP